MYSGIDAAAVSVVKDCVNIIFNGVNLIVVDSINRLTLGHFRHYA